MKLVIFILIFVFIISSFTTSNQSEISNPLIAYIFFQLKNIIENLFLSILIFGLLFLFITKNQISKRALSFTIIYKNILSTLTLIIISAFSAFAILAIIAFIELNLFSLLLNTNPNILGVKTNPNEIFKSIEKNNIPPLIISSDSGSENEIISIAKSTAGTNNFYSEIILSSVPEFLIAPIKNKKSSLFFLDNTLVITRIDSKEIQVISPLISYLFIKNYFPDRYIKFYPKVKILNTDEYEVFRKNDSSQKSKKIDLEISKTRDKIEEINQSIEENKSLLNDEGVKLEEILADRDKEYNSCLSEGTYTSGKFVAKNSRDFCKTILEEWETDFVNQKNIINNIEEKIKDDEALLKENEYISVFFDAQKKLNNISSNNIPSELGVFEPPESIKIIINDTSSTRVADFFATLIHEYLHYSSFISDKRLESSFFEEALTEYFARKTIKNALEVNTNIGYPVGAKIIDEIENKNAETDLADIYFSKDQDLLERKLDLVYGESFYVDNIVRFESLLYTSDPQEILSIANIIMNKIEGQKITEEDLFSNKSEIN